MEMTRIAGAFAALSICAATLSAQNTAGNTEYSLPRTAIVLEVEATAEHFTAGPYARFAQKLLGISVRQQDETLWSVTSVKLGSTTEADPERRYSISGSSRLYEETSAFMSSTPYGLISVPQCDATVRAGSSFKADAAATSPAVNSVPLNSVVLGASNLEAKAAAAAEMILSLRDTRFQIITGDTDATYSGEAMGAVLSEIDRLEQAYMSLFAGSSEFASTTSTYTVVPKAGEMQCVAFRLSGDMGLLAASDGNGTPFILDIKSENVEAAAAPAVQGKPSVKYEVKSLVPAVCDMVLSDGSRQYLQARVPVYQLGAEITYPVYSK